jgi:hypothetical protein
VLTADSAQALGLKWATPTATADSFSYISSVGLSGSSVTISGISGMGTILVVLNGVSTDTSSSTIRFTLSGTSTYYNYYGWSAYNSGSVSINTINQTYGANWALGNMAASATGTGNGGVMIFGANSTGLKIINTIFGCSPGASNGQTNTVLDGFWDNTAKVTSFTFSTSSGNFDAGQIEIYGAA